MPVVRRTGFAKPVRAFTASDGSDNVRAVYLLSPGDKPKEIVVSVRGTSFGATMTPGFARLVAYRRAASVNVTPPNTIPVGPNNNQGDATGDGECIADADVGTSQGPATPARIPIRGITIQEMEEIIIEVGTLTDSGGGNNGVVVSLTLYGDAGSQTQRVI